MDINEMKTLEWRKVRALWEQYQSLEHVERGYNPDAVTKARGKFYAAKAQYEKAFSLKWHEDDMKTPAQKPQVTDEVTSAMVNQLAETPTTQPPAGKVFTTSSTAETKPAPAVAKAGHNNPPADDPAEEFRRKMAEDYQDIIAEAERLYKGNPKKCEDDEYAERLTVYTSKLSATIKKLEAARIAENKPVLEKQRMINGYFNDAKAGLEKKKTEAKSMLDPWLKHKAQQEQAARIAAAEQMRQQAEALEASQKALYDAGRPVEAGEAGRAAEKIEKHADRLEATASTMKANVAQVKVAGASASLRTRIINEIVDRHTLDLEKLRPYLDIDALQKAVDIYFKLGGTDLRGVEVKEVTETVIR